ncbi:hypothetical protein CBS101457_000766 [Exobasidium rhododendri]|nr:hypothetical protein CBS101457_000766 [Exobasidium rhododendri]
MPSTARILPVIAAIALALAFWDQYRLQTLFSVERLLPDSFLKSTLQGNGGVSSGHATVSRRVVAVADLHGDLAHTHNVFRMAGLIDNQVVPNWIGGHDVLVSTGDIVDRGDDTIALYELFIRLREQAALAGGAVYNCLGNHEMMNALGDLRYVLPGDTLSFGGEEARRKAISSAGWIGQDWLANYSVTHTIPLLVQSHLPEALAKTYQIVRASFVHGGIHPSWAALGVDHINRVGGSLLLKALDNDRPNGWLPPDVTDEEMQFYGENGPLWNRHYALADEVSVCKQADIARQHLSVDYMVMGHTPHLSGFVVRCSSTVLAIDTGLSRAYSGLQSALVFDTELSSKGGTIWQEEITISALYKGRKPQVIERRRRRIEE